MLLLRLVKWLCLTTAVCIDLQPAITTLTDLGYILTLIAPQYGNSLLEPPSKTRFSKGKLSWSGRLGATALIPTTFGSLSGFPLWVFSSWSVVCIVELLPPSILIETVNWTHQLKLHETPFAVCLCFCLFLLNLSLLSTWVGNSCLPSISVNVYTCKHPCSRRW